MTLAVEVSGFGKRYKKNDAVKDVSLHIETGEIYGLIGPDGAGKSTLMQAVSGVLRYDTGRICVFGQPIDSDKSADQVKQHLGFMPQGLGLNLYPDLSIEENIDFFANLRGVSAETLKQRKAMLLDVSNLAAFKDRSMKNLSGGMKQKLGLVCTLIHQPGLVILDEPTTGVDPVSRRDFWEMLNQLVRDEKMTALISTAYMDEASRFNRLSVMHQGQVLDQGTADEIVGRTPGWLVEIESNTDATHLRDVLPTLQTTFPQAEELGQMIRISGFEDTPGEVKGRLEKALSAFPNEHLNWHFAPVGLEEVFINRLDHIEAEQVAVIKRSGTDTLKTNNIETPLIQADGLVRRFGDFTAADQVSFDVKSGEIFGLLGANGAGKSTVIKMLTGILPPSEGAGFVAGHNMASSAMAIKESIGYMSQAFSLYLDLTVGENIDLFGRIYGLSGKKLRERRDWVLKIGHLEAEKDEAAGSLPMGKRQRLALGCALIHEPKVLFLDEPTSGVDPIGRREFWRILVALAEELNVAILVTTHYMLEAEHCHRLALMQAGKVVAYDSPQALKQDLKARKGQVLSLKVSHPYELQARLEAEGFGKVALFGSRVQLFTQNVAETRHRVKDLLKQTEAGGEIESNIRIEDEMVLEPSLEDVFIDKIESARQAKRGGL